MYDIENYYNAETIKEAVTLLKEHPDARVISGGSDVLIKIREGKMAGTSLVSIRDIKEIKGVRLMESGDIYIGAGADSGSGGSSRSGWRTTGPQYWYYWRKCLQWCGQCGQCTYTFFTECHAADRRWNWWTDGSHQGFLSGTW